MKEDQSKKNEKAWELHLKYERVLKLYWKTRGFSLIHKFFDISSKKNLDKKIEVLEQVVDGNKAFSEIDGFYDILENYPKDKVSGDKITIYEW
jgi:hypothetical protein